jgi:hypothetical protein
VRRALVLLLALVAACGGGGADLADPGPSSGLDRSVIVTDLTEDQAGMFCDWMAGRVGSYDGYIDCGGSHVNAPPRRSACADLFLLDDRCTATVGDLENCYNDAADAEPCTTFPPSCVVLITCAPPAS